MAHARCNHSPHHCVLLLQLHFSASAHAQHFAQRNFLERSMTSAWHCCRAGSRISRVGKQSNM
eukprot:7613054-Alexandrium_andersonii.AAC.1